MHSAPDKPWYREVTPQQRRALIAASLGWMLDSMDVMLYSMVLSHLMQELGMSKATAGSLNSLTLLASAVGGILFGVLADRIGRTRALIGSILIYSIFTAACGFAANVTQLAIFRVLLGLGMGGEWATGAALVSETWPDRHRGKALGFMQSSWAIGYAIAALVTFLVLPRWGWRAVFFAGVVPALVTLWIRHSVKESELWLSARQRSRQEGTTTGLSDLFRHGYGKSTLLITAMNAGTMFGWWGLFTWIPPYLALPQEQGGAGLSLVQSTWWIVLMQVGMWLGYVTFGFVSDVVGRKRTYIGYVLIAAALVPIYGATRSPLLLMMLGPLVAFFGTGYFTGFAVISAELFPTSIRATAQGFSYNLGRGVSAIAPYTVGSLAQVYGLGAAFSITSAAFLIAALFALGIPETRNTHLQ
jgi:MFS family permease